MSSLTKKSDGSTRVMMIVSFAFMSAWIFSGCASAEKSTTFTPKSVELQEVVDRGSGLHQANAAVQPTLSPDFSRLKAFADGLRHSSASVDADVFLTYWLGLARSSGPSWKTLSPSVQSALQQFVTAGASAYRNASDYQFYTDKVPVTSTERTFVLPLEGTAHLAFDLPVGGAVSARVRCPEVSSQIFATLRELFTAQTSSQTLYIKNTRDIEARLNLHDGKPTAVELVVFPSPHEANGASPFQVTGCSVEVRRSRPEPVNELGSMVKVEQEFQRVRAELARRYIDPEISIPQSEALRQVFGAIVRARNSPVNAEGADAALATLGDAVRHLEDSWKRLSGD